MKKKILLFMLSTITVATTLKAAEKTDSSKIYFENAFTELKTMLEGKLPASFERAVFVSENAYWGNKYSYRDFQKVIDSYLYCIEKLISANDRSDTMNFSVQVNANGRFKMSDIRYTEKEKKEMYENTLKNWAIFKYITDTTFIFPFYHPPFSYASNDPFGKKNWANSQVLNLLASKEQKGNCFALTGFYKILSDRLNAGAKICTAPQHIYIQHQDPKGDFYNVELATAGHPGDGMIQTLTYTTNEAIMSGIALRSYNDKESIGLCLINLAKSYEHKFNTKDDAFILKCAELALKHDSLNLNALLLKQQVLDERIISYAVKNKIKDINRLKTDQRISPTLSRLQKHLSKLYELGYRQMPFYMQQMILNGFSDEKSGSISAAKNPSPFTTVKPKDPKDEQYWTLSHGAFQEVFEHKKVETYGHFTFNTEAKNIASVDTSNPKGFIIDPVAFAYDFGARMYDARLGIFTSVDPLRAKYPSQSPYSAFNSNPIMFVDPSGMGGVLYAKPNSTGEVKMRVVFYSDVVGQTELAAMKATLESTLKSQLSQTFKIPTKSGSSTVPHSYIDKVKFNIQVAVLPFDQAVQEASTNTDIKNNYFYVAGGSGTRGGFQQGNAGFLMSKDASGETMMHEALFTLGFYTNKGDLHENSNNAKSVLNSMPPSNQEKYFQTILPEDMADLFTKRYTVKDPYYDKTETPLGEKTNQTYSKDSEEIPKINTRDE